MLLKKKPISSYYYHLSLSLPFALILASSTALAQTPSSNNNYNWTGAYVGAGGGLGAWIGNSAVDSYGVAVTANQMQGGRGGFGTIILGYDYQFNNSIVAGAFIDGDLGRLDGNMAFPGFVGTLTESTGWGLGARLGWLINPTVLPYLIGAYSQARYSNVNLNFANAGGVFSGLTTPAFISNGWFLGGGMEAKLNAHFSLRGEYRWASYGTQTLPFNGAVAGVAIGGSATQPFNSTIQTFRAVVAYKF